MRIQRRVYAIEIAPGRFWPIPFVSNGVAWRTVGYWLGIATTIWALCHIVLIGDILTAIIPLGAPMRYVALPGLLTYIMVNREFEGRQPHRWLWDLARFVVRPRRRSAGRKAPARVEWHGRAQICHDRHSTRLHTSRIHGPAVVEFNVPVTFGLSWRSRAFAARPAADGKCTRYEVDDRLEVRVPRRWK